MMHKYPFRVDILIRSGGQGREARSHTFETLREARKYIRDASRRPNYIQSDLWVHLDTDTMQYTAVLANPYPWRNNR